MTKERSSNVLLNVIWGSWSRSLLHFPSRYFQGMRWSAQPIMECTNTEIKDRDSKIESRRFSKSNLLSEERLCLIPSATIIIFFIIFISKLVGFLSLLQNFLKIHLFIVLFLYLHNILLFLTLFRGIFLFSRVNVNSWDRQDSKQTEGHDMVIHLRIHFGSINGSFHEQITRFHSIFVSCCAAVIWTITFGMSYKHWALFFDCKGSSSI